MPKNKSASLKKLDRLTSGNGHFLDKEGNVVLLRGVNVSGSSKIPVIPDGTTALDQTKSLINHRDVSFVGRPFSMLEASEHFDRLKKWGFNFLRFLVTWEAIEHSGIGIYDEEYLDYIVKMVALAEKKGIYLFLDPHQDVWSRMTGGDGAPGWTLETVGFDIKKLISSDSVILHHAKGSNYRRMSWPLNYQKYPTATMFSLFFGGEVFAPNFKIEGKNIQNYLQDAYISAMTILSKRVSKFKNVVGIDTLNEPSPGFIRRKDLKHYEGIGSGVVEATNPFQEMCLSEGIPVSVSRSLQLGFFRLPFGSVDLNGDSVSIWKTGSSCVWKNHGVWAYDPNGAPMLLKPNYFSKVNGKQVDFFQDFMKPFVKKFKTNIQKVQKQFFIFMESDPTKLELEWNEPEKKGYAGVVNATHWYDVVLLFTKRYFDWFGLHSFLRKPVFGKQKVLEAYLESIKMIRDMSMENMNSCPTVIGETGIPMDMEDRIAFKKQDYRLIEKAMDRILTSIERNFVNVTLWNYTPDNTHEFGDRWNEEDLSIYSKDTNSTYCPDHGRGTRAFSRPYPVSTTGIPKSVFFDMNKSLFKYSFESKGDSIGKCTIFLPEIHYKNGIAVTLSSGSYTYDKQNSLFHFVGEKAVKLNGITIIRKV
ncbi:MAG: cellulase family glycosylhydrolase [Leptospiraceae bacterium]|nr:cellulase family glycosylhydrolase [Leptospiraceae bacterium]